jgi:hypothetical protein
MRTRGLLPRLVAAFACLLMLGLWTFKPRPMEASAPLVIVEPPQRTSLVPTAPIPPELVRFALNALLAPLLDDAVPPSWTDAALEHICGPGTRLLIDGQALERYRPIPATAFTVHWTLDRCLPFGLEGVELTGRVELQVFHEDDGLSAIITPERLQVDSAQGRAWLQGPFSATLSLAQLLHGGG